MHKIYSYSRIGTNENNMKIRVWTVLWTIIRNARNHCQDVNNCGDEDHCQYHLGIDTVRLETTVRIESTVRIEMSMQIDDQDQWSALYISYPEVV